MTSNELTQKVTDLVTETILEASGRNVELGADTPLISSGYLDSLAVLQLFTKLQETFEIELDVDDLTEATFGTPMAIAQLIDQRL